MKPTDDERREAAQRLRGLERAEFDDCAYVDRGEVEDAVGLVTDDGYWYEEEGVRRLADPIEPEPERTTTGRRSEGSREWLCDGCGGSVQGAVFVPELDAFVDVPNYCPNCGAKVVGER